MLFGNYLIVSNKQLIVGTQDRFEASVARLSLVHSVSFLEEIRFEMGVCSVATCH